MRFKGRPVPGCRDETTLFRKIILPAAMPSIVVGLRISFGTGWAAIIAAELVAERVGFCLWPLKLLMNPTVLCLFLHPIFKPTKPLCSIMSDKSESS